MNIVKSIDWGKLLNFVLNFTDVIITFCVLHNVKRLFHLKLFSFVVFFLLSFEMFCYDFLNIYCIDIFFAAVFEQITFWLT